MNTQQLQQIINTTKLLDEKNFNRGSSGNCSMRIGEEWWITPSGASADELNVDNLVHMDMRGNILSSGTPSSEWRFHHDIYLFRSEINFIIHTHSQAASAFSCLRRDLPAFHYMIAVAGGDNVRCTDYQIFGSEQLSDDVLTAIDERKACLIANHGMIAIGKNQQEALNICLEIENLCEMYLRLLPLSSIKLLTSDQMAEVIEKFKTYGANYHAK